MVVGAWIGVSYMVWANEQAADRHLRTGHESPRQHCIGERMQLTEGPDWPMLLQEFRLRDPSEAGAAAGVEFRKSSNLLSNSGLHKASFSDPRRDDAAVSQQKCKAGGAEHGLVPGSRPRLLPNYRADWAASSGSGMSRRCRTTT